MPRVIPINIIVISRYDQPPVPCSVCAPSPSTVSIRTSLAEAFGPLAAARAATVKPLGATSERCNPWRFVVDHGISSQLEWVMMGFHGVLSLFLMAYNGL